MCYPSSKHLAEFSQRVLARCVTKRTEPLSAQGDAMFRASAAMVPPRGAETVSRQPGHAGMGQKDINKLPAISSGPAEPRMGVGTALIAVGVAAAVLGQTASPGGTAPPNARRGGRARQGAARPRARPRPTIRRRCWRRPTMSSAALGLRKRPRPRRPEPPPRGVSSRTTRFTRTTGSYTNCPSWVASWPGPGRGPWRSACGTDAEGHTIGWS